MFGIARNISNISHRFGNSPLDTNKGILQQKILLDKSRSNHDLVNIDKESIKCNCMMCPHMRSIPYHKICTHRFQGKYEGDSNHSIHP